MSDVCMVDDEPAKELTATEKAQAEYEKIKSTNDNIQAELLRGQKLKAEIALAGTSGGHIDAPLVSPEDQKTSDAQEFFKGTALGDAITQANG